MSETEPQGEFVAEAHGTWSMPEDEDEERAGGLDRPASSPEEDEDPGAGTPEAG